MRELELDRRTDPYPHVIFANALTSREGEEIVNLLESSNWIIVRGEFYKFYELIGEDKARLDNLIKATGLITRFGDVLSSLTSKNPKTKFAHIGVQRYRVGSCIGPHNDHDTASTRVILNFTKAWSVDDGGIWYLSKHADMRDAVLIPPLHNTGFSFSTDKNSFHALSVKTKRCSYTVILECKQHIT